METNEILNLIEDKEIQIDTSWYIHATQSNMENVKQILSEGIKCSFLLNRKGNHFNGKYYISLYKENSSQGLNMFLIDKPKFIVKGISPCYADMDKLKFRRMFINTRIPLRTSEWDGEFQEYLKIETSKFVALEYSLAYLLTKSEKLPKETLKFLRNIVIYLKKENIKLPIYDFSSSKEINKEKVLSLKI